MLFPHPFPRPAPTPLLAPPGVIFSSFWPAWLWRRRLTASLRRPWRALGRRERPGASLLASMRASEEDWSRLGGRLDDVREESDDGVEDVEGMLRAGRAVEERASGVGLVWLGSSWRSHIPAVDWLRAMRSRPVPTRVGVGGSGGMAKVPFRLFGVGGVMPDPRVEPVLEPDPARVPALDAGRRKPDARDVLRLATLSQAWTSSPAIWRTRTAGS